MKNKKPPPAFAMFEWMIAWRYLRSRKSEGGVSIMTWISLIGITLAVFALIATLAVRSGFRTDFTAIILGANAHITIYKPLYKDENDQIVQVFKQSQETVSQIKNIEGVERVAAIIKGQVMASGNGRNTGVQVFGETLEDLKTLPLIMNPEIQIGNIENYNNGVAIGIGVARELGLTLGDKITLISPEGLQTAFGTSPRINSYQVTYIFGVGRYDIDRTRIYMPRNEAQIYFNREGHIDEYEIMLKNPHHIEKIIPRLFDISDNRSAIFTWKDENKGFLDALKMEDNVMFIVLSILVLLATMNIVSGLIMLVKNKGRDIGILRTMGLSQGSIMRIFFICGASIGVVGTIAGILFGCLFVIYIDPIFTFVNYIAGGGVWDPATRMLSKLPAELNFSDILKTVILSLGLSFIITIFPARRAAKMNPVEALRYE